MAANIKQPTSTQSSIFATLTAIAKVPSKTPIPTTPPEPIILTGSGDSVVDFNKWDRAAILHVKYFGGSNFAIVNYDSQGTRLDLLVNTIGAYDGVVPLDFLDDEYSSRFEITASGPWEIEIMPFTEIDIYPIPGIVSGNGDYVFLVAGKPDKLNIDASQASRNFAIWGYNLYRNLLVNEIAPYTGTVLAESDMRTFVIIGTGEWSIEITTR